jgi:trk system potassium uptake protein TrkA
MDNTFVGDGMMRQYAVIGLGKFGASVACALARLGHQVLAIDIDEDKVQRVADEVTHAVQADATDEDTLRAIGIRNFDVVIVSIGHDVLSSILSCLILKDLGVSYVVGKANDELHGKLLEKIGIEKVVYPERDMGVRLAATLTSSNILEVIELSPDYDVVEIAASSELIGRTLRELNLRARFGVNIVAIRKVNNEVKVSPGPNDLVQNGDVLLALGTAESLGKLENLK